MNATQLRQLAGRMRDIIDLARRNRCPDPYVTRELRPGVEVILAHDNLADRYSLILRSQDGYPEPGDVLIVAAAFGLDIETILPDQYRRDERHPVTNRRIVWHTIRLQWRDAGRSPALYATAPCEA